MEATGILCPTWREVGNPIGGFSKANSALWLALRCPIYNRSEGDSRFVTAHSAQGFSQPPSCPSEQTGLFHWRSLAPNPARYSAL